jgi:glycosyltransferase involved in cell wall biosynthesis
MENNKEVLFAAKLTEGTGNYSTACRLIQIFTSLGYSVTTIGSNEEANSLCISDYYIVIALHALHFAPLLQSCKSLLPTIVIVGGTDINCSLKDDVARHIIVDILQTASKIVVFNRVLKDLTLASVSDLQSSKVTVIPQSLDITADISFSSQARWRDKLSYTLSDFVCMLPAGLRGVKAPHIILDLFSEWHTQDKSVYLLLVGPVLDTSYVNGHPAFCPCITNPDTTSHDGGAVAHNIQSKTLLSSGSTGVRYLPPISRSEFLSVMSEMDVVLNTSESEGMCGAILEAMMLEVPVVAR